jgi:transketolase C-terminal domain/subunit
MEQEVEAQAYDAVCRAMGEAVWQLIATGQAVSHEAIAIMVVELAEWRPNLTESIALSVLRQTQKVPLGRGIQLQFP